MSDLARLLACLLLPGSVSPSGCRVVSLESWRVHACSSSISLTSCSIEMNESLNRGSRNVAQFNTFCSSLSWYPFYRSTLNFSFMSRARLLSDSETVRHDCISHTSGWTAGVLLSAQCFCKSSQWAKHLFNGFDSGDVSILGPLFLGFLPARHTLLLVVLQTSPLCHKQNPSASFHPG